MSTHLYELEHVTLAPVRIMSATGSQSVSFTYARNACLGDLLESIGLGKQPNLSSFVNIG